MRQKFPPPQPRPQGSSEAVVNKKIDLREKKALAEFGPTGHSGSRIQSALKKMGKKEKFINKMKKSTIFIGASFFLMLLLQAEARTIERNRASDVAAASRSWIPGAMVEVEMVKPVLKRDRDGEEKMVDLVVKIVKVFTGPQALENKEIQISPARAFPFPPERWCAYGTRGVHGASVDFFQAGRRGLLWIFQRKERQTSRGVLNGQGFSFATGFSPVWDRTLDVTDPKFKVFLNEWNETRSMMQVLKTLEGIDDTQKEPKRSDRFKMG